MKCKRLVCAILVTSLALGAVTHTVLAEEANVINSKGEIEYIENTDGVVPIDPEKPKEEITIDPEEGMDNQDKAGALRLDVVSHLKFGQQKLTTKASNYNALPTKIKGKVEGDERIRGNYVQLTDQRPGDYALGWVLTAKVTTPFTNDMGQVLKGAMITYANPFVNSEQEQSHFPTVTPLVTLDTSDEFGGGGGTSSVIVAQTYDGSWGTYTIEYGRPSLDGSGNVVEDGSGVIEPTMDKSVNLSVPVNALSTYSSYKAEITWTIRDII